MTRFERELSGALGAYWKASAEKELDEIRKDLEAGKITIDENGIARNCIGRALMSDMLEKLTYITTEVSIEATNEARAEECHRAAESYKASRKAHGYSQEELNEMRAAFGEGARIVDAITGQTITL